MNIVEDIERYNNTLHTGSKNYQLIFSKETWLLLVGKGVPYTDYTEDEINNHNQDTGYIGTRHGVDGYVRSKL